MDIYTGRAKFLENPKSTGVAGILKLNEKRFQWCPNDPKAAQTLDVLFQAVKNFKASKETPKCKKALLNLSTDDRKDGYLFEFENFPDRDECRNHVAQFIKNNQTESGSKQSGEEGKHQTESGQKASAPQPRFDEEVLRKMKLLGEDLELQKLHRQLVRTGVISEDDFWASRKAHNLEELKSKKQRTGLKSAMLADVRPIHDGRTNKVTFNLSPEIIHQIFAEKPAVHRAFLSNVPSKMSEVEFWTKYCRADLLNRTQIRAAVAAEAEADEHLAMFLKDDDIIADELQKRIKKVDPTVDMLADIADDYTSLPGHGIFCKEDVAIEDAKQVKKTLVHDINRHASVVLDGKVLDVESLKDVTTTTLAYALLDAKKGSPSPVEDDTRIAEKRSKRVHEMTKVDDLEGPPKAQYVELCIKDPRSYFDSQRTDATGGSTNVGSTQLAPEDILSNFRQQCAELQSGFSMDGVVSEVAIKVMDDLTKDISSRKFRVGKTAEKNILNSLPSNVKDDLLQLFAVNHELLRHFWAAHPLTSNSLREKASKIKDVLVENHRKLQAMKEAARSEYRHHLSQLVQPMVKALDAAFQCWENDEKRTIKSSQNNRTLNGMPTPG